MLPFYSFLQSRWDFRDREGSSSIWATKPTGEKTGELSAIDRGFICFKCRTRLALKLGRVTSSEQWERRGITG